MKRTIGAKKIQHFPDAINASPTSNFTQVPNDIIRNPNISSKATKILLILLSNKTGWTSYQETIQTMMKEGPDAIRAGLNELEELGYLKRYKYRDKVTKQWKGILWAYTSVANDIDISQSYVMLEAQSLEFSPESGKASAGFSSAGKSHPNNTNDKNTKSNNIKNPKKIEITGTNSKMTKDQFKVFWELYPKKIAKAAAEKAWNKLITSKPAPDWVLIKRALLKQIKTTQWLHTTYIPYPSTWLNGQRWLDEIDDTITTQVPTGSINSYKKAFEVLDGILPDTIPSAHIYEDVFIPACQMIADKSDKASGVLFNNLIGLIKYITSEHLKYRIHKNEEIPSVELILFDYVEWLEKQTYLDEITPAMFQIHNVFFQKFYRKSSTDIGFDILTGELYGI